MQQAWAYLCRSFFIGSINGGGTPSEIRDPLGGVVAASTNYFDFAVTTINLDSRVVHLGYNFGKLDALKKKVWQGREHYRSGQAGAGVGII